MYIYLYGCEDSTGTCVYGPLDDIDDAREAAQRHGWKLIEYKFALNDSELVEDYTKEG